MRAITFLSIAAALGAVSTANAQPAASVSEQATTPAAWSFAVAPRLGLTVPASELGAMAVIGVEATAAVAAEGRLGVSLDLSWSRPGHDGSLSDSRVPSPAMYTIEQTEIVIAAMLAYRFAGPEKSLVPWVAGGPLLHVLRTQQTTTIAPGENTASGVEPGVQLAGGVDLAAGPGYIVGDVRFAYSKLDNVLTGSSNAGKLMLSAGYRFTF